MAERATPVATDVAAPDASPSAAIMEVRNVSQAFVRDGREFVALRDVTLAVEPGEVLAILGPSGCGKSTLLRLMTGLIHATRGQVLAHGRPLDGVEPGASIGFQSLALYSWLTVTKDGAGGRYK
jgi:NitT/TauT family transport system ATP-binding protein